MSQKERKKIDCSHGRKEKNRRRRGRLISYQIPNPQKERKKKRKEEEHGRLFAHKKIKKERKEKNNKISQIPNAGGHLGVPCTKSLCSRFKKFKMHDSKLFFIFFT